MKATLPSDSDQEFIDLLELARKGDPDALGHLIDRCRPYLLKIAHEEGDADLQAKVGDSDMVQYTCLDAVRAFPQFRGRSSAEMLGWLRQILRYRINGIRDQFKADKRDLSAEISLQIDTDDSRNDNLQASTSSPSEQAVHQEERDLVERALRGLSELDRAIIEMRQKDGQAFAEIARQLHLTEEAAQKRWVRAIQTLKEKVRRPNDLASE